MWDHTLWKWDHTLWKWDHTLWKWDHTLWNRTLLTDRSHVFCAAESPLTSLTVCLTNVEVVTS